MQNEEWLNCPVYTLTRKQAFLVMCLVELVDGAEYYIDELQEKLGITGTEGYEGKDIDALNHADKHDRIRHSNERWELHSEIQVATGGKPSFINGGLVDVTAVMEENDYLHNQAARAGAEGNAGPWEWCRWDNDSFEIVSGGFDSDGRVIGSTVVQPDASDEEGYGGVKLREDADYISAANPATVLALLDKLDGTESMFLAACADLGAINAELGLDPDDGGAEPILYEVKRLLAIEAAARNLVKVKGRHNSELAMNQLLDTLK